LLEWLALPARKFTGTRPPWWRAGNNSSRLWPKG